VKERFQKKAEGIIQGYRVLRGIGLILWDTLEELKLIARRGFRAKFGG
jgi:hypothetical protein